MKLKSFYYSETSLFEYSKSYFFLNLKMGKLFRRNIFKCWIAKRFICWIAGLSNGLNDEILDYQTAYMRKCWIAKRLMSRNGGLPNGPYDEMLDCQTVHMLNCWIAKQLIWRMFIKFNLKRLMKLCWLQHESCQGFRLA